MCDNMYMNNNGSMNQRKQQAREEYAVDISVARLENQTPIKSGTHKLTSAEASYVLWALGKLLKEFDG